MNGLVEGALALEESVVLGVPLAAGQSDLGLLHPQHLGLRRGGFEKGFEHLQNYNVPVTMCQGDFRYPTTKHSPF